MIEVVYKISFFKIKYQVGNTLIIRLLCCESQQMNISFWSKSVECVCRIIINDYSTTKWHNIIVDLMNIIPSCSSTNSSNNLCLISVEVHASIQTIVMTYISTCILYRLNGQLFRRSGCTKMKTTNVNTTHIVVIVAKQCNQFNNLLMHCVCGIRTSRQRK